MQEHLIKHLAMPKEQRQPACTARACLGCHDSFPSDEACFHHEEFCDKVHRCPGCPKKFGSAVLLLGHVRSSRNACPAKACCGCDKVLDSEKACSEHELKCPQAYACPGCTRRFVQKEQFDKHLALPQRSRPKCKAVCCVGCKEAFGEAKQCEIHEECCFKVLICPGCDRRFGSTRDFQTHLDAHEAFCSAAQCGICSFVFSTREEFLGHWRSAHPQAAAAAAARAAQRRPAADPSRASRAPPPGNDESPKRIELPAGYLPFFRRSGSANSSA